MKVLITGANSLLGSNLVRVLDEAGMEVRGMVRPSSNLLSLKGARFESFSGEVTRAADLAAAVRGCQVVVHVAANTNFWPSGLEHYLPINVEATRHAMEASKKEGVQKFIYVSSSNAFGYGSKEHPADETSPYNLDSIGSGYMTSKYMAQQLVLEEVKQHGFPAVVVNPTFMLGAHDAKPSSGTSLLLAARNRIMPVPPGGKSFVHVRDVAVGILQAILKGRMGECYILSNQNLTFHEFYVKVKELTGKPSTMIFPPPWFFYVVGSAGSIAEKISKKEVRMNKSNTGMLCLGMYYSSSKAVRELGMPQTPVEHAIADAWQWFKENKYL